MTSPMVRPGATGKSHKAKGIKALAWISYGLSVVAGAALASTFVGDMIAGQLEALVCKNRIPLERPPA